MKKKKGCTERRGSFDFRQSRKEVTSVISFFLMVAAQRTTIHRRKKKILYWNNSLSSLLFHSQPLPFDFWLKTKNYLWKGYFLKTITILSKSGCHQMHLDGNGDFFFFSHLFEVASV